MGGALKTLGLRDVVQEGSDFHDGNSSVGRKLHLDIAGVEQVKAQLPSDFGA